MDIVAEFFQLCLLTLLGFSGVLGLLAVISPQAFAFIATRGSHVVHPGICKTHLDRWFDIDSYVLAHSRLFGLIIIASEGFIWFVSSYGPEAYSKTFLLMIVCAGLIVGVLALGHILRQKREIETNLAEAHTDALTNLPNRRAFDVELARRLAQRQRQGTPLCLQIIDIDNFKLFNDNFGHVLGDAILKQVASTLNSTARQMDIVARLGGDEFAVLLPGSNLQEASHAAERIRTAISDRPFSFDGHEHLLTISSGVAEAQVDDDASSLLKRADSALYAAKEAGRNCSFRHGGPELATIELEEASLPACVSPTTWQVDGLTENMS